MQKNIFNLSWLDPRDNSVLPAGIGYFIGEFGEYQLKIDEEPNEKQYFLKPLSRVEGITSYRLDLVIKNKEGKFLKRQMVGKGSLGCMDSNNIYIIYGSKFKTLVLNLGEV